MPSRRLSLIAFALLPIVWQPFALSKAAAQSETDRQFAHMAGASAEPAVAKSSAQPVTSTFACPNGTKNRGGETKTGAQTVGGKGKIEASIFRSKAGSEPKFPIAGKFSRAIQTATGANLAAEIVAGRMIGKIAGKKLGGKVKAKVRLFSLSDFLAGKVKAISLCIACGSLGGLPIGNVKISSDNPIWFNFRRQAKQPYGLATPVMLTVTGILKQDDLRRLLETEAVSKAIHGLKADLPGLGGEQLKMLNPEVTLAEERISIKTALIVEGADPDTGVDVTITAKPQLAGCKIMLENLNVTGPDIAYPISFAKFTQDLLNPILDLGKFDRADRAFRLSSCSIDHDRIAFTGSLLLVPKNYLLQQNREQKKIGSICSPE